MDSKWKKSPTPCYCPVNNPLNLGMLLSNVGAYVYFMMDGAYMSALTMLSGTTTLSSVMAVTLTMTIGGKWGSK
ncbi:hypothetical protein DPMN_025742 [Dreissena polymorpha]|uniref:proton-translocating NAD(P)(+) transhydrogenase n=1 Tax=Dreissena polymorpha TaxID=45954 RepID=A0A9D4RCT9_DREPO|nr:hypothetical protein DPMN_025742 [Dreissena polymorpha]